LKPSLNWLLIFVPNLCLDCILWPLKRPPGRFVAACLAIIPLAGWLGTATEHLAAKTGEGIGGLLNATFGNAAELIIALMALHRDSTAWVKASLTGLHHRELAARNGRCATGRRLAFQDTKI